MEKKVNDVKRFENIGHFAGMNEVLALSDYYRHYRNYRKFFQVIVENILPLF